MSERASQPPRATYRLQFNAQFTFADAAAIIPYLAKLGISHVYASPIHKARPGSPHGYDIVDHAAINPELGGEDGFRTFSDTLMEHRLGLLLDIVPNHMGVGEADNAWWLSVLEWGELSPYALAFDIDWERIGANHKLIVPFLGDRYGGALERGEIHLSCETSEGGFSVWHYEHRFPLCPLTYPVILDRALAATEVGDDVRHILAISEELRAMGEESIAERRAAFPSRAEELKQGLVQALGASPSFEAALQRVLAQVNGTPGVPQSFGTLHRLLEAQAYRLAYWRVAASDINYRRFFDINALAGLRIEEPEIFAKVHATVFRLICEGRIDGLRIDHLDGLADPEDYILTLREVVGPDFYIVVEKILEPGEELRPLAIAGTTGYDALNLLDGVLVDSPSGQDFERIYRQATGVEGSYRSLLLRAKLDVLLTSFTSELEMLVSDLKRIADYDPHTRDYTMIAIRRALQEIIAHFPVYRGYISNQALSTEDNRLIVETVARARRRSALPDRTVHEFIATALLCTIPTEGPGSPDPDLVQRFGRRFQQLTGPVTAKGLEDTLFYRYGRLIALNEVGGDPGRFGVTPEAFHEANAARARNWPHAMIATATHDTKRGEDARARLLALSWRPRDWSAALVSWRSIVGPHLVVVDEVESPDANDQYILLQSLLAVWPIGLLDDADNVEEIAIFASRMEAYLLKSLREAKLHTSWVNPQEGYEETAIAFVRRLIAPGSSFLTEFAPLARQLAVAGMAMGLARTALKCTLPGVPDIYQGTEFWDLSLVDPDNRRPVDYEARRKALELKPGADHSPAWWWSGHVKQHLLARLLRDRAKSPGLYAFGDYVALEASGERADDVLAFRRTRGEDAMVVAIARWLGEVPSGDELLWTASFWKDTTLPLQPGRWREVTSGSEITTKDAAYPVAALFDKGPVAILRSVA